MTPFDYSSLYPQLAKTPLAGWGDMLPAQIAAALQPDQHGKLPEWKKTLDALPEIRPSSLDLLDEVRIGVPDNVTPEQQQQLDQQLRHFHPWRKGPFDLFGIHIDTEWRSDWKWDRLKDAIAPLNGRLVLDVGCGNGYHMWRMIGAGAELVLGLDPFLVYVMQYHVMRHFMRNSPAYVLPLGIEKLPENLRAFDTIFSMGVLYHRRSPFDHLMRLRDTLRPGGELVLETLVIDGKLGEVLVPESRYARMNNVWFIPSSDTLISWLRKCRFQGIKLVDITHTTVQEQRSTDWMTFESLVSCLDVNNSQKTIEGHPAPKRAILTAVSPK
ncbi:MAG: tRNA 5-methoxyuridine(34)/uridine 5-oxyacetic acid(34) synthase CmoB [Chloroflexi bacterium]|nr:MAG: tRNA 5-methoxyuridine(34)/uridine 5-oxyacetic acid(34) synthase CmoB [Chloroflexota bacterium]